MRHSKTFCLFAITISQNLKFWSVVPYATTSSVWKTAEIYIEQSFHVIVLVGTELNWQESVFSHKPNKFEWTIMMYFQNKHSLIVFCLVVLSYCVQIGKYYKEFGIYVILKHFIPFQKRVTSLQQNQYLFDFEKFLRYESTILHKMHFMHYAMHSVP